MEGYNGNRFFRYVGNGSGDVIIQTGNDTDGGNPVTLYGVYGGRTDSGDVEDRIIIIGDDANAPNISEAFGGFTIYGSARRNTLTFQNGTITTGVYGGTGSSSAEDNTVTISDSAQTTGNVSGGDSAGNVTGNSVTITDNAEVGGNVRGGYSYNSANGAAERNTVTISGSAKVGGEVRGGYGLGGAFRNTVTLDGNISLTAPAARVYGGYSSGGTVTSNTITLGAKLAPAALQNVALYGGECVFICSDAVTGNTLEVLSKGLEVGGVHNFENINFTLPDTFNKNTDTMLTAVGGAASVLPVKVNISISISGTPSLNVGDTITLLHNASGLQNVGGKTLAPGTDYNNIFSSGGYTFELSNDATSIYAKLTKAPQPTYTVTGKPDDLAEGGTLVCTSPVEHGGNTTCTLTIADGYTYTGVTAEPADNAKVSNCDTDTKKCPVSDVKGKVTVTATFERKKYTVTGKPDDLAEGGKVECDKTEVEHGDGSTVTCTATPDDGFEVDTAPRLTSDTAKASCDATKCILTNIIDNVTVIATFKPSGGGSTSYVVTGVANPEEGGGFTCDSPVKKNENTTCTAAPNPGYAFTGKAMLDPDSAASSVSCHKETCTVFAVEGNAKVTGQFRKINPTVASINDDRNNKQWLQPGKANTVAFTLGVDSFNGESGTLEITGVTKSQALQKAYFDNDKNTKSIAVLIENDGFTADITPEKGEKTIDVTLTLAGVGYPFSFKVASASASAGTAAPVPTMSDIGLLLSGIALAGAAAPALRRRERKEREQREQRKRDEHATNSTGIN